MNVVELRPKPSVPEFIATKKEIGTQQEMIQKHKRTKQKLIFVVSDSEHKASEKSSILIQPYPKPNFAKKRTKTTIPFKKIVAISEFSTDPTSTESDNIPLYQVFKPSSVIASQAPPTKTPHQPTPAQVPVFPNQRLLDRVNSFFLDQDHAAE